MHLAGLFHSSYFSVYVYKTYLCVLVFHNVSSLSLCIQALWTSCDMVLMNGKYQMPSWGFKEKLNKPRIVSCLKKPTAITMYCLLSIFLQMRKKLDTFCFVLQDQVNTLFSYELLRSKTLLFNLAWTLSKSASRWNRFHIVFLLF